MEIWLEIDEKSEGKIEEPPRVLWPDHGGGSFQQNDSLGGKMIPLQALKDHGLFTVLYEIDVDLAKEAQSAGCPTVGGLFIVPTIRANHGAAPRI